MAIRKSTKIWLILAVVGILLCALPLSLGMDKVADLATPFGVLFILVAGTVVAIRFVRFLARKFFYRLSRRLAFSYFLIGVFPIPLLALLVAISISVTLGQFEAYRVDEGLRLLGLQLLAGKVPGARRAKIQEGLIVESEVSPLPSGESVSSWIKGLDEPRFIGGKKDPFFAVADLKGGSGVVRAVPVDDLFFARVAELSGVALKPISTSARTSTGTGSLQLDVDDDERQSARSNAASQFIYPPEATPDDHASSLFRAVSWFYTSRPYLGPAAKPEDSRALAAYTRMSIRRAVGELFSQGGIQTTSRNWMLYALLVLASILLGVYLIALLIAYLLVRTITKTVNRLSSATTKVSAGDFSVRIATKAHDQVGDLARSFDSMASSLGATVKDRAAKELLDREIDQARLIAQKLLPAPGAVVEGLNTVTFFEPFAQMGGDYYDFLQTRTGEVAVAIGDVSGHGLPTALLVAAAKAALSTLLEAGELGTPLFIKMNRLLHRSTDSRNYMTLSLARVLSGSRLELTNAGHPAPYLISGGKVTALEMPAFPLGLFEGRDFPTREFPFGAGDRLVLYTDGIIECRNTEDDAYGFERFESVLHRLAAAPLDRLRDGILHSVAEHCGSFAFDDDRTLVICERQP
jgi:sigma-B regulation protein RsbU (phosphoserine phosphatase)